MFDIILLMILAVVCVVVAFPLAAYGVAGWPWLLALAFVCFLGGIYAFALIVVEQLTKGREDN
jgi:hypothetical protein